MQKNVKYVWNKKSQFNYCKIFEILKETFNPFMQSCYLYFIKILFSVSKSNILFNLIITRTKAKPSKKNLVSC